MKVIKGQSKKRLIITLPALAAVLLFLFTACGSTESDLSRGSSESAAGGEESGTQFALNETFDYVRAGARLVLSYDSTVNAFIDTVENTTGVSLKQVRVEVHLSNGTELGLSAPVDLALGQVVTVTLLATSQPFTTWGAHPEVGSGSGGWRT